MPVLKREDRKLTPEEKAYARRFLEAAQSQLTLSHETNPPTYSPPNFLAIFRHNCRARLHNESTALELKEMYVSSEEKLGSWRGHEVEAAEFAVAHPGHEDFYGRDLGLPLFGFIYREGTCKGCKDTARSPAGRLVLQEERPPTAGRMARD